MNKKVSIIGATGKLAVPIIERLVEHDVEVTAIVRDLKKAEQLLPNRVLFREASLDDVDSLKSAFEDCEYLYLNLSSPDQRASFIPEIDGIRNILEAKTESLKQVLQISGIGAYRADFHADNEMYFTNKIRNVGFDLFKNEELAHTILHASWFLDALPWFVSAKTLTIQGEQINPIYWTNSTHFADCLFHAIGNIETYNKDLFIQGQDAITMKEAARIYSQSMNNQLEIVIKNETLGLFEYFDKFKEEYIAQKTMALLNSPAEISVKSFFDSLNRE